MKILITIVKVLAKAADLNLNTTRCCFIAMVFLSFSCQFENKIDKSPNRIKLEQYRSKFNQHFEKDPDSAQYYLELRKALADESKNPEIQWDVAFDFSRHYFIVGDYTEAIDQSLEAKRLAEKMVDSLKLAKVLNVLGNVQQKLGNYTQALDYFYQSINIRKLTGNHSSTSIPLTNIGLIYKDIKEYDKAEKAFAECLEIDKQSKDTFGLALDYNHLGIVLKKAGKYDEARKSFFQSLSLSEKIQDTFQKAFVLNNLGLVEAELNNFRKSIKYLEESLAIKRALKTKQEIATTLNYLAEVYLKNGDFARSQQLCEEALNISHQIGSKDQAGMAFQILSGVSEANGDPGKALGYFKSFKHYEDSLLNETKARQIIEMETIYESDKKEKKIAQLTIARQKDQLRRNRYVTGLMITLFIAVFFAVRFRYRIKKNREKSEAKIKSFELALDNFMQRILEKNQRIEELNQDLERARDEISNACPSYTKTIDNLMQSTILTDEDWMRFKKLFLQAHPGFFNNLREKFADITETEERLIALTRLNLTTKEIAAMLGISGKSVNKSRYRLRKKLGIATGEIELLAAEF